MEEFLCKTALLILDSKDYLGLVLRAAIMGSQNTEEFIAVTANATGVLLKYLEKPIPFREGTPIEIEIPWIP